MYQYRSLCRRTSSSHDNKGSDILPLVVPCFDACYIAPPRVTLYERRVFQSTRHGHLGIMWITDKGDDGKGESCRNILTLIGKAVNYWPSWTLDASIVAHSPDTMTPCRIDVCSAGSYTCDNSISYGVRNVWAQEASGSALLELS